MSVSLLIDGYNLMYATGAGALVRGPTGLSKARTRMLGQIAAALDESERNSTQVVFDANRSGEDDNETVFRSITVTYAAGYDEADDLIEEIIRQHPNPRTLTVVSSDNRIQRCAQARRATAIDCDQWLMQMLDRVERKDVPAVPAAPQSEPGEPKEKQLSPEEIERWMREFGL